MIRSLLLTAFALAMLSSCSRSSEDSAPEMSDAAEVAQPAAAATPPAPAQAPAAASATKMTPDRFNQLPVNEKIDTVLGNHIAYEEAIKAFQQAVAAKDAESVADLVSYPMDVVIDGEKTRIEDQDDFVNNYDKIITPDVANIVTQQKYDNLFVNGRGVMFGSGEARINGICKDTACNKVEVKVVNLRPSVQP